MVNKNKKISEGAYGCIFKPGYQCNGKVITSDKYITKIQRKAETSNKEATISELVRKINHYEDFFSPIIEAPCTIDLATIEDDEIKTCGFIADQRKSSYESNKIKYVGKRTLSEQLAHLFKKKPQNIFKHIFETHLYLLDGFKLLRDAGIIHFDVKENNIVCKDKTSVPIIIDFGLSIEVAKLPDENYKYAFFTYGPDYGPWCIDIVFLTYMANKLGEGWQDITIDQKSLLLVISDFFNKNDAILTLFSKEEQTEYRTRIANELTNKFINTKSTWKQMADYLVGFSGTWDNYAVCVVFLYIIKDMDLSIYKEAFPKLDEYIKLMKSIIVASFEQRSSVEQTKEAILKFGRVINKMEKRNINRALFDGSREPDYHKQIYHKIMTTKIEHLKNERHIYDVAF
jgi:hypothetical protein